MELGAPNQLCFLGNCGWLRQPCPTNVCIIPQSAQNKLGQKEGASVVCPYTATIEGDTEAQSRGVKR